MNIAQFTSRTWRVFRMPVALRVSLGLSALMVSWVLILDVLFGLMPDQALLQQQLRQRTSEALAIQLAVLMENGDARALGNTLKEALSRNPTIRSIGIRGVQGALVLQVGEHPRYWVAPPPGQLTADNVRVPLLAGKNQWGDAEVSFQPLHPEGWRSVLTQPIVILVVVLGLGGVVLFSAYLRRVLQHLDPSSVIPERVRVAFDAFSEGVMVVDATGRIMLANTALRAWVERDGIALHGCAAHEIPRLKAALPGEPKTYPWMRAMSTRAPLKGDYIEFAHDGGEPIKATINCAPVFDGQRNLRGCIVTFADITELERLNRRLVSSLEELEAAKAQVDRQNEELRHLATRDPLTGCLNRRAFFEKLDGLFVTAKQGRQPLSCIMVDIDHFKGLNDRFGHALGDLALQVVSRCLFSGLRESDLLCRYGGEEFCIILPEVDIEQATSIAERLRGEIEAHAGKGIRSTQGIKITTSIGVCLLADGISDPTELIDCADQALYASKHGGRNRVTIWQAVSQAA